MVSNLQMLAYFLNLLSIKHYLVEFWDKLWASTANNKCMGVLQTFRQARNESKFQHNIAMFWLKHPIKNLYSTFNYSNMFLWSSDPNNTNSIVYQVPTHTFVLLIENLTLIYSQGDHLAFIQYGQQRWKATAAALLSPIFWLEGHIPNQKSL